MFLYRRLLIKHLHGKAAVLQQIMFEKQPNLFIQGYMYLVVHFIMIVLFCIGCIKSLPYYIGEVLHRVHKICSIS